MRSTIVITGVTRGLGRALAEQFSFMGHTVIGCGRNKDILKICQNLCRRIQILKLWIYLIMIWSDLGQKRY